MLTNVGFNFFPILIQPAPTLIFINIHLNRLRIKLCYHERMLAFL